MSGHRQFDEDFPAQFRDEVIVGHFARWNSHLSASRYSIYTQVFLIADKVLADKSKLISEGGPVNLVIPGGTVFAPGSKKLITYAVRADDFPLEPNTQYLIFLDYRPKLFPFFEYVKAWKADRGFLEPLTQTDMLRVSHGALTHNGVSIQNVEGELSSR